MVMQTVLGMEVRQTDGCKLMGTEVNFVLYAFVITFVGGLLIFHS